MSDRHVRFSSWAEYRAFRRRGLRARLIARGVIVPAAPPSSLPNRERLQTAARVPRLLSAAAVQGVSGNPPMLPAGFWRGSPANGVLASADSTLQQVQGCTD